MRKFKTGDRVVLAPPTENQWRAYKGVHPQYPGDTGTVIDTIDYGVSVAWDNGSDDPRWIESWLEPASNQIMSDTRDYLACVTGEQE